MVFDKKHWQCKCPEVPKQQNSYDCGVFMCKFAERISAGKSFACLSKKHNTRVLRSAIQSSIEKGHI